MGECGAANPGPAYALRTLTGYIGHDFTKYRAPAYSLGLRVPETSQRRTPGPYNVGNVDRNGRYPYSGWTLESRAAYRPKATGPGPADYRPERAQRYTPAYSFGLKLGAKDRSIGPSPADYFPQQSSGGPAYSIGTARRPANQFVSPGPQAATNIDKYKQRAPAYSMGLAAQDVNRGTPGPGPAYLPGRISRQVPHAYSFGLKHHKCAPPLITREDMD